LLKTLAMLAPMCSEEAQEERATMSAANGILAPPSGSASVADVTVDPSTASFRALALQVRAMGLLTAGPATTG